MDRLPRADNCSVFPGRCTSLVPDISYRWAYQQKGIAVHNAATGVATVHPYQLDTREVSARKLLGPRPPNSEEDLFSLVASFGPLICRSLATARCLAWLATMARNSGSSIRISCPIFLSRSLSLAMQESERFTS